MAPVLKKLNEEWQGKVNVKFVDVWKYPNEADNFPLQVIHTQFFFDGQGKPFVPSNPEGMQMIMYSVKDTQEHVYTSHHGGI
jgi:thioredoxin 1